MKHFVFCFCIYGAGVLMAMDSVKDEGSLPQAGQIALVNVGGDIENKTTNSPKIGEEEEKVEDESSLPQVEQVVSVNANEDEESKAIEPPKMEKRRRLDRYIRDWFSRDNRSFSACVHPLDEIPSGLDGLMEAFQKGMFKDRINTFVGGVTYADFSAKAESVRGGYLDYFLRIMDWCKETATKEGGAFLGTRVWWSQNVSWFKDTKTIKGAEDFRSFMDYMTEIRQSKAAELCSGPNMGANPDLLRYDLLDRKFQEKLLKLLDEKGGSEGPENSSGQTRLPPPQNDVRRSADHVSNGRQKNGNPELNGSLAEGLESKTPSEQADVEFHQDSSQLEANSNGTDPGDFLRGALIRKVVERLRDIRSEVDFARERRFYDYDAKRLLEATRTCCADLVPKNKVLESLRQIRARENVAFNSEENDMYNFFSPYKDGLLENLYNAFEVWKQTPGLSVVLLCGKPGTGKDESLKRLLKQQACEDMAVISVGAGNNLVGDSDCPGFFELLLLRNSYWRCIYMEEELSPIPNPSLQRLVGGLIKEEGVGLVFDSKYFGVKVPIKNIVIACTSNCPLPGDDGYLLSASGENSELSGYLGYRKVEYMREVFDEVWTKDKIGKWYLEELKRSLPHCGEAIWNHINTSSSDELKGAMLNLRNAFDEQVSQFNMRENMVCQKVSSFIMEGGEDEWLGFDGSK